ncbi:MAG: molybdopterin-dependent oxidoreductase [Bryobacteraceae bacterium]|nr:molybdopterin-dependent oxidoreductase [Bryobacteraceae bacterium]
MRTASIATLAGLALHYASFLWLGTPLLTDTIAEWIMARTPNSMSVLLLEMLGEWAKPFAATGGLAVLGGLLRMATVLPGVRIRVVAGLMAAALLAWGLPYHSPIGLASFWVPALLLSGARVAETSSSRRWFLASAMSAGTGAVAVEAFLRERGLSRAAVEPLELFPYQAPPGVTPVHEFYGMSKNTVDPSPDPSRWRLKVWAEDRLLAEFGYRDLMRISRENRYVTLRCISNTLKSNLMGTALWTGFPIRAIVDPTVLADGFVEAAVIGEDGHGDSFPLDYFLGGETMLAVGMNGRTLNRTHGFPLRLIVPRYYGFKNVKWISSIRFVRKPYLGTWPKMGYRKEALIHTCSSIGRVQTHAEGLVATGVAFAGDRGIRAVRLRADGGAWVDAALESPLSPHTWTRWRCVIPVRSAQLIEARAQDGAGNWQADKETPLFPGGVEGPTVIKVHL